VNEVNSLSSQNALDATRVRRQTSQSRVFDAMNRESLGRQLFQPIPATERENGRPNARRIVLSDHTVQEPMDTTHRAVHHAVGTVCGSLSGNVGYRQIRGFERSLRIAAG
jgi:hypothetical protein